MDKSQLTVFYSDITDIDEEAFLERYRASFTDERLARIDKATNPKLRKNLIATGVLLDYVFVKYSVYKNMVVSDSHGKPYIRGKENFFFNVSNSGKYVVVAVGDINLGVDIQKPIDYSEGLVRKIMSAEDRTRLENDIVSRLNLVWAVKEAYVKYTGEGICRDLATVSYCYEDDCRLKIQDGITSVNGYYCMLKGNYALVLCAGRPFETQMVCVNISER